MIRSLAPDELTWFLSQYYRFIGHGDPRGLARRVLEHARDLDHEAVRSFVYSDDATERPKAGVNVLAPQQDADDQNLYLSNLWFEDDVAHLQHLVTKMLSRHPHEAAHVPLYNFSNARVAQLRPVFGHLGFKLEGAFDLAFSLSELPPLGSPLVIEAWSHDSDEAFRQVFEQAETEVSDARWAWLKRWRGRFLPSLWFITRETLDLPPVGYAFYGTEHGGIDGVYYLTAVGVLQEYRFSSEMLRRVVLSSLHELASVSPLGRVETTLPTGDPKLIQIFELLGFDTFDRYERFIKRPD